VAPPDASPMKLLMVPAALCVGLTVGAASMAFGPLRSGHADHNPIPIPKEWSEAQLAAFVAQSDRNIDAMAGRTVAAGEVYVDNDGLRYWKSEPGLAKKKCRTWCPKRSACHDPE
jgi:hypothetical protein